MREPNTDPSRPRAAGRSVLIADDDPLNRQLTRRILESRGWSVAAVADGEAALARLAAERFDLVLLDVEMPGLDGPEVTARVRAGESQDGDGREPMTLIALTAHRREAERRRCLDAGMDGYLTKPFDPDGLDALLAGGTSPAGDVPARDTAGVDWQRALAAAGGDRELLERLTASAGKEVRQRLAALASALAASDLEGARLAAHGLGGAMRIFGAGRARRLAAELEASAAAGRMPDPSRLKRLSEEADAVTAALAEGPRAEPQS